MSRNFEEKCGIVRVNTEWGHWWQNVDEVYIEVDLPDNVKAKDIKLAISSKEISCCIRDSLIFKGKLFSVIHGEEAIWVIENDGKLLNVVLPKADYSKKEIVWTSLMADGRYKADPSTLHEINKKLDLEKFQIENPGMDFSRAKLASCYDKVPENNEKSTLNIA